MDLTKEARERMDKDNKDRAIDIVAGLLRRKEKQERDLQVVVDSLIRTQKMTPFEICMEYREEGMQVGNKY